ncbi:MAG: HAD-IA family hydrolase [Hydrogenophilales bacterium]|nr:HAD-IA family hydrolase [Hydrogenophilales bacterium]
MSEPIGAVLFDLDGTLADTALDLAYALNELRRRHGLAPLPHETIRPQASHGTVGLLKVGFEVSPKSPNFAALRAEYLELYTQHICDRTVLFPGMAELLDELEARKLRWGVVTNKPARFTLPLLKALNLEHRAACIISGDSTPNSKPHPEPLLTAAAQVRVAPAACLYVGDAERDVEAAVAAGMKALIANYGYLDLHDQPDTWGAYARIDTPADILGFL